VSENAGGFREIRQAGLECLGPFDDACVDEVLALALESLRLISEDSRLCVSLLGVVEWLLDALGLEGDARRAALRCMGEKNIHELRALCDSAGVRAEDARRLERLTLCGGAPRDALEELAAIGCPEDALREAERLTAVLPGEAGERLLLDFSVLGDMRYYNDIAFQGFVRGVPASVLSGGAYGRLLRRMGRTGSGVGFACYLDKLERWESGVNGDA
jgi:ATP phosphoribosyltransferase regulatory subunit